MKDCVLFSPIGLTDPIRKDEDGKGTDGPLLHILRHYQISKAVLFLTKETYAIHRKDNRYIKLARMVSPSTQFTVCGDDTLTNVNTFEIFDTPFRAELEKLHRENPDSEVLVNISSGTPQMEASLYLLKAILPFSIRAIQVSTPAKSSNKTTHLPKDVVLDDAALTDLYNNLRDNAPDAPNRCVEVGGRNAQATLLKKNILALVENYDYTAALTLAQSAPELFSAPFLQSLQAAKCRLMLETSRAISDLSGCFEEDQKDLQEGYEYILMLDTLVQREAYGDYVRGISPALVSLFVLALRHLTGLDVYDLCVRKSEGAEWLIDPEQVTEYDPELRADLDERYSSSNGLHKSPLSADVMLNILRSFRKRDKLSVSLEDLFRLRKFEWKVRNSVAHQITPVTEEQVLKMTGGDMTVAQAQDLLKQCFAQISGRNYRWDGYEKVNRLLAERIDFLP